MLGLGLVVVGVDCKVKFLSAPRTFFFSSEVFKFCLERDW